MLSGNAFNPFCVWFDFPLSQTRKIFFILLCREDPSANIFSSAWGSKLHTSIQYSHFSSASLLSSLISASPSPTVRASESRCLLSLMTLGTDCLGLHKNLNKTFVLCCPSSLYTANGCSTNCRNAPSTAWRNPLQSRFVEQRNHLSDEDVMSDA